MESDKKYRLGGTFSTGWFAKVKILNEKATCGGKQWNQLSLIG
jgi:hypothetical protein